jgi:hypothetical protein
MDETGGVVCARGNGRDVRRSAAVGSRDVARSSAAAPRRRASAGAPLNAAPCRGSAPPRCAFKAMAPVTILTGTQHFITKRNHSAKCGCPHAVTIVTGTLHCARRSSREAPNPPRELRWALPPVPTREVGNGRCIPQQKIPWRGLALLAPWRLVPLMTKPARRGRSVASVRSRHLVLRCAE